MGSRLELHDILLETLGSDNVYFQPPPSYQISYPCIIYSWSSQLEKHADNQLYMYKKRYSLTVIDPDPDTEIPEKVSMLPMCTLNRTYTADNLNHYAFDIYY